MWLVWACFCSWWFQWLEFMHLDAWHSKRGWLSMGVLWFTVFHCFNMRVSVSLEFVWKKGPDNRSWRFRDTKLFMKKSTLFKFHDQIFQLLYLAWQRPPRSNLHLNPGGHWRSNAQRWLEGRAGFLSGWNPKTVSSTFGVCCCSFFLH